LRAFFTPCPTQKNTNKKTAASFWLAAVFCVLSAIYLPSASPFVVGKYYDHADNKEEKKKAADDCVSHGAC
jgi:hypothetical protein